MIRVRDCLFAAVIGAAGLALPGCGEGGDPAVDPEGGTQAEGTALYRYDREFIFVAPRSEAPLVAPFAFRATDDGATLHRSANAWLARGATWDRFLDTEAVTSRAGGVWRVVPQGGLRVIAGGPTEIETLRFERGERRLRLDVGTPLTGWSEGGDTRFRLLSGSISIGPEALAGTIFEVLRVEQMLDDGWPAGLDEDAAYLISGDSLHLVAAGGTGADSRADGYGWFRIGETDRKLTGVETRWLEVRPLQDARRDIPRRWSLGAAGADLSGELEAVGYDALIGPERGGRRSVDVRFTVEGWISLEGVEFPVAGLIRHTQQ
jgi:hypothetical protein